MPVDSFSYTLPTQTQRTLLLVASTLAVAMWAAGGYARWAVVFGVLLVIPGWWLVQWTGNRVPWYVRAVVGPALIAVVAMWGAALDVAIPVSAWAVVFGGAAFLCVRRVWRHAAPVTVVLPTILPALTIAVAFGALVWSRVAAVRTLALPPWVDAVHHALLIRVAVEAGHAPWVLTPYLPVTALTYHSGFHSVMAVLLQLSGIPLHDIATYLLVAGQVWNVLAVAMLAGVVWSWSRSWWAVAATFILIGIVSFMPAYYLSWGRYTLLVGLALLPAALWTLQQSWQDERRRLHPAWIGVALTALALVHMVVFVMAGLWAVVLCVRTWRVPASVWRAGIGTFAVTAPWWWLVVSHTQAGAGASAMHVVGNPSHNGVSLGLVWALNNRWLIPAALVAGLWALRRRQVLRALVVVWFALVLLAANPVVIGLPYVSFFTNETITTALFVPIGLVLALELPALRRRIPSWAVAGVCALVLGLTLPASAHVVNATTIIATADDRAVLSWAAENLPADAAVLTNATGWMWGVDRGADGGWWLLPIAGIPTTTPPVLYTYAAPDTVAALHATTAEVAACDGSLQSIEALVAAHREINYIYASERGAIKPSVLDTSTQFEARYRSGDVALYAVIW